MKTSSLESKTVRPGFGAYAFYHSDRHLQRTTPQVLSAPTAKKPRKLRRKLLMILALALIGFAGYNLLSKHFTDSQAVKTPGGSTNLAGGAAAGSVAKQRIAGKAAVNNCAGNYTAQLIKVSITRRHIWVCEAAKQVRDYPVITGMQKIAENATPPGTYTIYAKQRDTVLTGTASTGSWRDPVSYWMPFLDNNYGTYGFHDASWRSPGDFGNIDPYSDKGSHGCVEMSVASSEWLYNWARVGTKVIVTLE